MFNVLYTMYEKEVSLGSPERFGQWFVNRYIKGQMPDMFYADEIKSRLLVSQWLIDHQYTSELPRPFRKMANNTLIDVIED